jgi:hypothetical protein
MTTQPTSPPVVVVRLFDLVRDGSWLDAHQAGIYTSCAASRIRKACNREDLRHIRVGHARGPILTRANGWTPGSCGECSTQPTTLQANATPSTSRRRAERCTAT